MAWLDLVLLSVVVVAGIWSTMSGIRPALIRLVLTVVILLAVLPFAANMDSWLRPALGPTYSQAIAAKTVTAVGGEDGRKQFAAALGPWQNMFVVPVAAGPEFVDFALGLVLNITGYACLAVSALFLVILASPGRLGHGYTHKWLATVIGTLNGFVLALMLMLFVPVFTLVERGTFLAEAVSGSAFMFLFSRLLLGLASFFGYYLF